MKHIFIAGPFRATNNYIHHTNIGKAAKFGMLVAESGAVPIIPHTMYAHFHGTITDSFWVVATRAIMEKCDAVLLIPGWQKSSGTVGEEARARELGIPVFDMSYERHKEALVKFIKS